MLRRLLSSVAPAAKESTVADVPKIPRGIPRFWKSVTLSPSSADGTTRILLDGRPVRSPSGNPLEIPSNKTLLALLVAGEWESQKVSLKAYSLPLVCLSYLWL